MMLDLVYLWKESKAVGVLYDIFCRNDDFVRD